MIRIGWVVGIRPEKIAEYRALHAEPWPEVLADLRAAHIHNFSIFLREPENLLFATFEYHGKDFGAEAGSRSQDQRIKLWADLVEACQCALPSADAGEIWAPMIEIFHLD